MFRKTVIPSFLSLLILGFSVQSFPQETSRYAVFDPMEAFEKSKEGQKAIFQLSDLRSRLQLKLTEIDNQILSLQDKIRRQNITLSPGERQNLELSLNNLINKKNRTEEDAVLEFNSVRSKLFIKIRDEMFPIIVDVAEEKGFLLVLDLSLSGVAYFNPQFNITAEVIKRYDASKEKIKFPFSLDQGALHRISMTK